MSFNQILKIRQIRAASLGQLFGLLLLLSAVLASAGLRVEADAEVTLLGEQIIDYVEVRQSGFRELTAESLKEISSNSRFQQIVVESVKASCEVVSG